MQDHFSGYLRRERKPLDDFEYDRALHQQWRSLILIREQQNRMIQEAENYEVVTNPLEIEKAFREDDL